ncbi:MAG: 3-hydroxyacyl-CoA dehydrogenase NAD-binding domain-containing protein [Blastocatellia bacterium]|nr:3-hydroxyacyl-CoA dehydrogenase NAD-binding domain-containing protein [Blastocatellia bacterium]
MNNTINWQVDADGIATLTIDLKDRPMNVITREFLEELAAAVDRVAADPAVKGAILTSGKSSFMAGADLKGVAELFAARDAAELFRNGMEFAALTRKMETSGKPFAAAINGTALGGGLEICLACHYRVAADAPGSVLGLPEVQVGLFPGGGGTQRLPRLTGAREALQLMMQGTHLSPRQALEKGIVHKVVAPGELLAEAKRWLLESPDPVQPWDQKGFKVPGGAGQFDRRFVETFMIGAALMQKETLHNYPAPQAIMSCVYEGLQVPIDAGLRIEQRYFTKLLLDPVARNMIRTLFVNKGAADKLARRPKGVEKLQIRKLGVLGAGMMGAGLAHVAAMAGIEVVLLDREPALAEKGKSHSGGLLAKRVSQGRMTQEKADAVLARIHPTADYADLAACELVIEAVFENREIKADVTRKAEAVLPAGAIFASNTSTLPITGLAEASSRPAQFIGLHFFSPVDKMPLVEIIRGKQTSDETLAKAMDFVQQIKKTPIVVNDSRGFYTSRFCGKYINEGTTMLLDGVAPALIENGARMAGMPVGPLALLDEVSIDLSYHIREQTKKDLGAAYQPASGDAVITLFYETLNRLGRKSGHGMYDYPEGGKKSLWPELTSHFPVAAQQPPVEEVKKRLLYAQALDAAACMDEGVLTDPADGDVGAILGLGFAPYTGGPLSMIDTIGVAKFVEECDRMAEKYGPRFTPPKLLREMAARGARFYPN